MDPGELDWEPQVLFAPAANERTDPKGEGSRPAFNETHGAENLTGDADAATDTGNISTDTEKEGSQPALQKDTDSDIMQPETAEESHRPLTAQERLALTGKAILEKGGMPTPEQLDAMGESEATARGAQTLILMSKEGSPEEQRAVKAMIDATSGEYAVANRPVTEAVPVAVGANAQSSSGSEITNYPQRENSDELASQKFGEEIDYTRLVEPTNDEKTDDEFSSPIYETLETRTPIEASDLKADRERRQEAIKRFELSSDEASRLENYVGGYMCYRLNQKLMADQLTAGEKNIVTSIKNALLKFPSYSGRTYRNLKFRTEDSYHAFLLELSEGEEIRFKAFSSTSKQPNGYPLFGRGVVHLVIDGKSGRDIADTFGLLRQQEVIFLPETQFRVIKMKIANDGNPLIFLQEAN